MLVNSQALKGIFVGFKAIFNKALETAKPMWDKIATLVPSSAKSEEYKWLGKLPRMREWVGERTIQNLSAFEYTIKNKDYEATIALDKNDIEDDSIGVYNPIVADMGNAAALHPDDLVFGLLAKGFNTLCYDGQYFFDSDHKDGDSPIQSNVTAKTLTITSYGAARATIMSYKDDKGNSLNIIPNLLVVPPQLEGVALRILKAETINNETNIYKDSAELLVVPQLSENPTQWFLMCTTKSVKPIIYQQRKKAELVSKDKTDDDNVFFQKQFIYGIDCRDNAGYGLWQLAYGSTGTDVNP